MAVTRDLRALWPAGLTASALWVGCSHAHDLLGGIGPQFNRVLGYAVPRTIPPALWDRPSPWPLLLVAASTAVLLVAYLLVASLMPTGPSVPRAHRLPALWFAAVAAGAIASLTALAGVVAADPAMDSVAFAVLADEAPFTGAYWGLLWGWLPALLARRAPGAPPPASGEAATDRIVLAVLLVLTALLSAVVSAAGARDFRERLGEQFPERGAQDTSDSPAPEATASAETEPVPLPEVAPGAAEPDPAWCGPDQSTLRPEGRPVSATGHRGLPVRLTNDSDEPCVLNGYPDVAFADERGELPGVTVVRGRSFMAEDAGAVELSVPPGGTAEFVLGWDAMATAGARVASVLYVAPHAGMVRESWPVPTDIAEGGEVAVTAWRLVTVD
ncbi:DUF4232 domain-containing protein [Nocardiopsis lucentensis]|uniref:DUF4232 domain-containing protein n=1 Tax=Nocardiopsis lucentensis TaxID=53441 RepID=UPI000349BED8|nr:DUF4232 domain-containing protein [Nocardiopsis lucentensis]